MQFYKKDARRIRRVIFLKYIYIDIVTTKRRLLLNFTGDQIILRKIPKIQGVIFFIN